VTSGNARTHYAKIFAFIHDANKISEPRWSINFLTLNFISQHMHHYWRHPLCLTSIPTEMTGNFWTIRHHKKRLSRPIFPVFNGLCVGLPLLEVLVLRNVNTMAHISHTSFFYIATCHQRSQLIFVTLASVFQLYDFSFTILWWKIENQLRYLKTIPITTQCLFH